MEMQIIFKFIEDTNGKQIERWCVRAHSSGRSVRLFALHDVRSD